MTMTFSPIYSLLDLFEDGHAAYCALGRQLLGEAFVVPPPFQSTLPPGVSVNTVSWAEFRRYLDAWQIQWAAAVAANGPIGDFAEGWDSPSFRERQRVARQRYWEDVHAAAGGQTGC